MFYKFARSLFKLYFLFFYGLSVYGKGNIPSEGALIVCSNHISWLDPPLLACAVNNRHVSFMAKAELFKIPFLKNLFAMLGAFPIKRNIADRKALRYAFNILEKQEALGLFPEGTRSKTGDLQPLYNGAALFALKSGAQVLPIAINGSYQWRRTIKVNIGKPLTFSNKNDQVKIKREKLDEITKTIMREIKCLKA